MAGETGRGLAPTAAVATVVAVVLAVIVLFVAQAATDNLLVNVPGSDEPQEVAVANVVVSTVLGGIVGAVLAWIAGRFTSRPRMIFVAVCVVALILGAFSPFSAAEETATGVWLNIMHLAAAVPIVGSLSRWLPEARA